MKTLLLVIFVVTFGVSDAVECFHCNSDTEESRNRCEAMDSMDAGMYGDDVKKTCTSRCAVSFTESFKNVYRGCGCVSIDSDCWSCNTDYCTPDKMKGKMMGGNMMGKDGMDGMAGSAAQKQISLILMFVASFWILLKDLI